MSACRASSTPWMSAGKTSRPMNRKQPAARGAGPSFFLAPDELPYAGLAYILQVFNHAHGVLRSVTLVQVLQPGAGIAFAPEAVPGPTLCDLLTVLDPAPNARNRFVNIIAQAAGAPLFIPDKRVTETAVHPAGGDQPGWNRMCFCRFCLLHDCIPPLFLI